MSSALDDSEITLTCPSCSHEFQETLGRLKVNPQLICPGCGGTIDIKFEHLAELERANAALDSIHKTIEELNRGD